MDLGPQLFLLPLGPDLDSGLWAFAHLLTGEATIRRADGKLVLTDNTGLVFVLLPGGRLPVEDGEEPGPLNTVDLAPFFLSKYEMTRGQWTRISAGWTSRFGNDGTLLHPADRVSREDCQEHLVRLQGWIRLPSEAQWEYGCRAGTTTPWWTGADEASLEGAARFGVKLDDGPLAVGTLRANRFGLHDVHGNLREWCQDTWNEQVGPRARDGLRDEVGFANDFHRVYRGGSYSFTAKYARSAFRDHDAPEARYANYGLRPASPVTP